VRGGVNRGEVLVMVSLRTRECCSKKKRIEEEKVTQREK